MMKTLTIAALMTAIFVADASAQSRTHRRRGALLGGLAGAALGAAIGDKGNNETSGALIGGAVGAVAGGAIGDAKDQRIDHNRQYHSGYSSGHYSAPYSSYHHGHTTYPAYRTEHAPQRYYAPGQSTTGAMYVDDVLAMLQNGLSEPMVIQQIQLRGMRHPLTVNDVIQLHRRGVSEPVISAMQGIQVQYSQPYTTHGPSYGQSTYSVPSGSTPVYSNANPEFIEPAESYRAGESIGESFGPSIMAPANAQ